MCLVNKATLVLFVLMTRLKGYSSKPIINENSLSKVYKSNSSIYTTINAQTNINSSTTILSVETTRNKSIYIPINNYEIFYNNDQQHKILGNNKTKSKARKKEDHRTQKQKFDTPCFLEVIKDHILWWSYSNGSLNIINLKNSKLTFLDLSFKIQDNCKELKNSQDYSRIYDTKQIAAFSAAYNMLSIVPYETLSLIRTSLKYLTLQGNKFYDTNDSKTGKQLTWAKFPLLLELLELDISNCSIEYVRKEDFKNLLNLRRLFLSNNKITLIVSDTFFYVPKLQYLDLSYTNVLNDHYISSIPTLDTILNLFYGVKIQKTVFKFLPELVFLDISHTKITKSSAVSFLNLGAKLKYISLCYTDFPIFSNSLFKNVSLEGLDFSGNLLVSYNMMSDMAINLANNLKYLYIENANLRELEWLKFMKKLRILNLAHNNINDLAAKSFRFLPYLKVLDLGDNHIGNWYTRAFTHNSKLRILNMQGNNINIITNEMLKDFEVLEFLGLSDNNFLCDCLLHELIYTVADNIENPDCVQRIKRNAQDYIDINPDSLNHKSILAMNLMGKWNNNMFNCSTLNIESMLLGQYFISFDKSYQNIANFLKKNEVFRIHIGTYTSLAKNCAKETNKKLKLHLLDYEADHYLCYNETVQLHVANLTCQSRININKIQTKIKIITKIILTIIYVIIGLSVTGVVIYLNRWHLHYYYSSIKSSALLTMASKDLFNNSVENNPNMIFDIFISYCQNDRKWVLDELLPNLEENGDISICLHERDFEVGVAILDNIISCMDRSRALMLIISTKFFLSHWCQFEMYLAQHRIFEASKEHLILVLLEDIPRNKRSKTLQYLMDIKTYIKWPTPKDEKGLHEEQKIFWKRLIKSLENIGIK